jgi:hypothetical protein
MTSQMEDGAKGHNIQYVVPVYNIQLQMSTAIFAFPKLFASDFLFYAQKIRPDDPDGFFLFVYSAE